MLHDTIKPLIGIAVILILILFVSESSLGPLSYLRLISSRGNVKVLGVGVYWDANCTSPIEFLDWGSLEPDSVKNKTVFIRNEGNEPSILFLNTDNWQPANLSRYMTLTWNYNGAEILPDLTLKVTLTLSTSASPDFISYIIANDVKRFNFDTMIGVNG